MVKVKKIIIRVFRVTGLETLGRVDANILLFLFSGKNIISMYQINNFPRKPENSWFHHVPLNSERVGLPLTHIFFLFGLMYKELDLC